MRSIEERALTVIAHAWGLLPDIKHEAWITGLSLEDLNAKHGNYSPSDGTLTLSTRLFMGDDASQLMMLDIDGNSPILKVPYTSRALHTCIHELFHAICCTLGIDATDEWLALSGWVEADDDPQGTARYWERRPGWPDGPSEWRYRKGTWFPREYSSRSPYEDAADTGTHIALGWHEDVAHPSGLQKFTYLRRTVWRETGVKALAASAERWAQRMIL